MQKGFKKLIVVVLTCLLVLSNISCFADEDPTEVYNAYLASISFDTSAWCMLDLTRELFVTLAYAGCSWSEEADTISLEAILLDSIYVTCDDEEVIMVAISENSILLYSYNTVTTGGAYAIKDVDGAYSSREWYMDNLYEKYYHIDGTALLNTILEAAENAE